MKTYSYSMSGTASGGQTWETNGSVELKPGDFANVFEHAMRDTFLKLTHGKAKFGNPGLGCSGPYDILRFSVAAGVHKPVPDMVSALRSSAVALEEAANILRPDLPSTAKVMEHHAAIARAALPSIH